MASSPDQPVGASSVAEQPLPRRHRPWGWIVVCVLLVVIAGGLAVWALGLQSDLDSQRDQTAQAQAQAEQANKEVDALSGQIDDISQAVTDAGNQLSQAGADAQKNAQTTLDGVETKLQSVKGQVEKAAADSGGPTEEAEP
jgi:peptidoglycan hydrolase CwlO-like protein